MIFNLLQLHTDQCSLEKISWVSEVDIQISYHIISLTTGAIKFYSVEKEQNIHSKFCSLLFITEVMYIYNLYQHKNLKVFTVIW